MGHVRAVKRMVRTKDAKIVALLHDVCEDSDTSLDDLREAGFPERIVVSVDAVSKRTTETYREYMARVKADKTAIEVKIADATHNSDISRIPFPTGEDLIRSERYMRTVKELKQYIADNRRTDNEIKKDQRR